MTTTNTRLKLHIEMASKRGLIVIGTASAAAVAATVLWERTKANELLEDTKDKEVDPEDEESGLVNEWKDQHYVTKEESEELEKLKNSFGDKERKNKPQDDVPPSRLR